MPLPRPSGQAQKSIPKERTVEQLTTFLMSKLETIDSKMQSVKTGNFKQRAKLQGDAFQMAMNTFSKIAVKAGMLPETTDYVGSEIEKFGQLYKNAYAAGLTGTTSPVDPIGPLQSQYDKIFTAVRLAVGVPADSPKDIYKNDMDIVSRMITAVSLMTADMAGKREEEKENIFANINAGWTAYFTSYFRDASAGAAQSTIRELVECIWGRKSYSTAYIMSAADPSVLRKEQDAMFVSLENEAREGSWSSALALKLLNAARSIEDSQTEYRLFMQGELKSLTVAEEKIVRRGFLAVEIAMSVSLTMYAGYHLYNGWESAAQIRQNRAQAIIDAKANAVNLELDASEALKLSKEKAKFVENVRKQHQNCTENVIALQERERVQKGTLSIGFDMRLRQMAAADLLTTPSKTRFNEKEAAAISTVATVTDGALMERQDKLRTDAIDRWGQTLEVQTDPQTISEGAVALKSYLRAIDDVPRDEILRWANSTGQSLAVFAMERVLKERQTINAPGTIVKDYKAAYISTVIDQRVVEDRVRLFIRRLDEQAEMCDTKPTPEVLEDSIALLHVLSKDKSVQEDFLESYIANTTTLVEGRKKECSQLKETVDAAELMALPFEENHIRSKLAYELAKKKVTAAEEANHKVQEEIARTHTDPLNSAVGAINQKLSTVWYYVNSFLQAQFYGAQIQQTVMDHPGMIFSTAFFPGFKDSWEAMTQLYGIISSGTWTTEVVASLSEYASKLWMLICVLNLISIVLRVAAPTLITLFLAVVRRLGCCRPKGAEFNDEELDDSHRKAYNQASQWKLSSILWFLGKRPQATGGIMVNSIFNTITWIGGIGSKIGMMIAMVQMLLADIFTITGSYSASDILENSTSIIDRGNAQVSRFGLLGGGLLRLGVHLITVIPTIEWVLGDNSRSWRCIRHITQGFYTVGLVAGIPILWNSSTLLVISALGAGITLKRYISSESPAERAAERAAQAAERAARAAEAVVARGQPNVPSFVPAPTTRGRSRSKSRKRK